MADHHFRSYTQQVAKITSTFLGVEDHGIFTAMIQMDYGDSGQGVGGFALDSYDKENESRIGTAYGMEWIRRFLLAAGVDSWERLKGRTVYVLKDLTNKDEWNAKVIGIRPLPTEPGTEFIFDSIRDFATTAKGKHA